MVVIVVYLNVGQFAWLFSERNQSFGDLWWGCHYTFNICFDTISISIGSLPSNRVKPKSSRSSCGLLNNNGHPSAKLEKIAHMWATPNAYLSKLIVEASCWTWWQIFAQTYCTGVSILPIQTMHCCTINISPLNPDMILLMENILPVDTVGSLFQYFTGFYTSRVFCRTSAINSIMIVRWKEAISESITLQGINISHLGKRKIIFKMPFLGDIIFKMPFLGDMLVPWRVLRTSKNAPQIFLHNQQKRRRKIPQTKWGSRPWGANVMNNLLSLYCF